MGKLSCSVDFVQKTGMQYDFAFQFHWVYANGFEIVVIARKAAGNHKTMYVLVLEGVQEIAGGDKNKTEILN